MKDVVIIANFSQVPGENGNDRFAYLAKLLKDDCRIELITSSFHHKSKKQREKHCETVDSRFITTTVYEPGYPKNICFKRFYSHWIWGKNVRKYLKSRTKPDVIYCAVPSLTGPLAVAKYCKRNDVKFIVDIQDLWPEAFKMVFKVPVISDLIFAPFNWIANGIYKRADEIVAVSDTYVKRALRVNKKCKQGHTVFLGTQLKTFDENVRNNPVEKPEVELWLGYCGTLGASYDITCVLDALAIVKERGLVPPKFMVMGDGPRRAEFENYAKGKNVNAVFTGRLPYDQMCGRLNACDIAVNPITHGAAQSIINKHGDYAMSGLPVLNTQECEEYRNLVSSYDMGYNCNNDNAEDLADKLIYLLQNDAERARMGKNARKCAEEKFDRKNNYKEIISLVLREE